MTTKLAAFWTGLLLGAALFCSADLLLHPPKWDVRVKLVLPEGPNSWAATRAKPAEEPTAPARG